MTRTALGAAAGVLSAAAGVGASLLVGALLGGAPTPVTAVGNRFVDATPGPLKDWAVRTFGENDKLVLLSGIGVVLAVIAAIIGIIGWRNRRLSLTLATGLGLVAVVAALLDRSVLFGVVAQALPSVVALVVSVGLLAWFTHSWAVQTQASVHRPASPTVSPTARPARSGPSPSPRGFDRRAFLSAALASGAVTVVGVGTSRAFGNSGATSRASIRLPRPTDRAAPLDPAVSLDVDGITPYLTANKAFYRVDTALSVPQVDAGSWSLRVHGMVDQDIELSFEDLLDMRLIERRITMTCVSNQVGGGLVGNATWLGVPLTDILDRVGVSSGADAVKSTAVDGFTIGTPISTLTDGRDAMIAVGMNGKPLPLQHGFPARMLVPGLYGFVSATKWLVDLEVTRFADFSAYWTDRGWSEKAPIKTESRIDVPRSFANIKAGKVPVAGVAWAQHTGIATVEVRVDDGPWREARLAAEDSTVTWRQWVYDWDAKPGDHTIEVRATDKSGYTQTAHRAPPRPDGATGLQSVAVSVG